MAKTKGSPKTLQARKPTTKKALEPGKNKMPEGKKNAPAKCNCKLSEGTSICSLCLESLGKDLQQAHLTPIPGPSTKTSDLGGVVALRCGHVFHRVCMKPLITAKTLGNMTSFVRCPCCRQEIKGPGDMTALFISFQEEALENSPNKCRRKDCVKFKKEAEEKVESLNDNNMLLRSQARHSLKEKQSLESEIERLRDEFRSSVIRRKSLEQEVQRLKNVSRSSEISRKSLERRNEVSENARLHLERENVELTSRNERLHQQLDLKIAQQDRMAADYISRLDEIAQKQEAQFNMLREESNAFYAFFVRIRGR